MIYKGWSVCYERATKDDGTLLFPERLTQEFLDQAKRTMGSYIYANQYQNEIIPEDDQTFRKEWIRYYDKLPDNLLTFAFVDPAISEAATADFTGFCVVSVDTEQNWYLRHASRRKINPTELIDTCFRIYDEFKPSCIGVEDVAFQRSIIHFAHEEMKRRGKTIPLQGIKIGTNRSKEARILSLVPRFEWGSLFLAKGLYDFELELAQFPRAAHDDILDCVSSINEIVHYPTLPRRSNEPPSPNDPRYESWYIQNLVKRKSQGTE